MSEGYFFAFEDDYHIFKGSWRVMKYGKEKYLVIETREDILKRLFILDDSISELNRKNKTKFVIFGGAAFLLKTKFRPTSDIDVYLFEEQGDTDIELLLNEVDIHTTLSRVLEIPPIEDFLERMEMINADFENIEVYVASAYDLEKRKEYLARTQVVNN